VNPLSGLKSNRPDIAIAATISGEATNACVFGLPSARFAKFLLKECTILFFGAFLGSSYRAHCPMHGPHAFVNILAFNFFETPLKSHLDPLYIEPVQILD